MVSDKTCNFAPAFENKRAFSSVGLEHLPYKQRVGGSNPSTPTQKNKHFRLSKGRLAQLVQSICLTSRGSAVRIRQRPPIAFPIKSTGGFQSGQMGQTVNLLLLASVVRIHHHPLRQEIALRQSLFFILFFYSFHFAPYILGVLGCPREALFLLFTLQQDIDTRSALLLVVKVVFVVFHTQSSICAT